MEPFIGQIMIFGGTFPPKNWAFCDGSLLPIANFSALFSILGTMYGGNGTTTFALPDLRGRVPIGMGQGPGLSVYTEGEMGGEANHTLVTQEMPQHNHGVTVASSNSEASFPQPGGNIPASAQAYQEVSAADGALGGVTCAIAGGGQAHNNMQPYTAMNYIIALQGVYPPRS